MMADGGGTPVAGRLAQQTLWRPSLWRAGGQWQGGPAMLDRHQERAAIDRVLDFAREGFSGTLVLRGGPGTGKTTLLSSGERNRNAAGTAQGFCLGHAQSNCEHVGVGRARCVVARG